MIGEGNKPFRVKDIQRLLENKNPNAYICLGGSVSAIDGKGGKLVNFAFSTDREITLYFEDEDKLIKD